MWEEASLGSNFEHALTLNLEAYDNASCTGSSSSELQIDTSDVEDEVYEDPNNSRKRKREDEDEDADDEDMPDVVHKLEAEIERQLDAKAKKSNLTVDNVKSIIKGIISNEHVLAMVRSTMKEQETNFYFNRVFSFTPKLTRAKTRELMNTFPSITWPISQKRPLTSKCKVLIEQDLPEDSSDEEYKPQDDEDDDHEKKVDDSENDINNLSIEVPADDEYEQDDTEDRSADDLSDSNAESIDESNSTICKSCTSNDEDNDSEEGDNCSLKTNVKVISSTFNSMSKESESLECSDTRTAHDVLLSKDRASQTSWLEDTTKAISNHIDISKTDNINDISCNNSEENIGQRTRSKYSLSDTPLELIESAFIPPDITTDMYDSECDDEDWKRFLNGFYYLKPDTNDIPDDDEADPEYNIMADEDEETEDKEELRADPGVKVPRKEVDELMAELFEYNEMLVSDEEDENIEYMNINTKVTFENKEYLDKNNDCVNKSIEHINKCYIQDTRENNNFDLNVPSSYNENISDTVNFDLNVPSSYNENISDTIILIHNQHEAEQGNVDSAEDKQQLLIEQHMRKHIQLLTQHFLMTYLHPLYHKYSIQCKENLYSLKYLSEENQMSVCNSSNLEEAIKLVESWEVVLSSESERTNYIEFCVQEVEKSKQLRKKKLFSRRQLHPKVLKTISESSVFLYPSLLPEYQFRYDDSDVPCYVPAENELIAIGLETFTQYAEENKNNRELFWKNPTLLDIAGLIVKHLMPTKKISHLRSHIRACKNTKSNPIFYYFQHKTAPPVDHYVIPCTALLQKPPCKQPLELLPKTWKDYVISMQKSSSS